MLVMGLGNNKGENLVFPLSCSTLFWLREATQLATLSVLRCICRSAGLQLLQPPDEEDEPELPQWRCYGHTLCQHAVPNPSESSFNLLWKLMRLWQRLRTRLMPRRRAGTPATRVPSHLVLQSWGGQELFYAAANQFPASQGTVFAVTMKSVY